MIITQYNDSGNYYNGGSLFAGFMGSPLTAVGGYVGVKQMQEQLRRLAYATSQSKIDPAQYDGKMTLGTLIALANAAPIIGKAASPAIGDALNVIELIKAPIKRLPYGTKIIEFILSPWIIDKVFEAILAIIRFIPGGSSAANAISAAMITVKNALATAASPVTLAIMGVLKLKYNTGLGDLEDFYGFWSSVKKAAKKVGKTVSKAATTVAKGAATAATTAGKAAVTAGKAATSAVVTATTAAAKGVATAAQATASAAETAARATASALEEAAKATAGAVAAAAKAAANATVDATKATAHFINNVAQRTWDLIAKYADDVYAAVKKYGCALVNNEIVVSLTAAGAGIVASPAASAAVVTGAAAGKTACAVLAVAEVVYAILKLLSMDIPKGPGPMTSPEPPPPPPPPAPGAPPQAPPPVPTEKIVLPATPPVVPASAFASKYPVGTIATYDPKLRRYRVAIPLGKRLELGQSTNALAAASHFEVAQVDQPPAGSSVVPLTPFQKQTDTLPLYKNPLFWTAVGISAVAVGGGGYALYRRRQRLTRSRQSA